MQTLSIDLETYSDQPLAKTGVYRYVESPDFEILLFAYSVDGGSVQQIDLACGEKIPSEILSALEDETVTKWAFNANFERICLSRFLGYPTGDYLEPDSWKCSIVKGKNKYQNRYCFSGKIFCGECGDTFKRRIHTCSNYKYAAWCCNTHIEDKNHCSMKFIRDDNLKAAFVTMINKLIFGRRLILKPYLEALKGSNKDNSLRRIQEIQSLLLENSEQRETLAKLMAQGYIDQILYNEENNLLLAQADQYKTEISALNKSISGDATLVKSTLDLLRFAEKGVMLDAFDEALFENVVTRIRVLSRQKIVFELKCGLTLTERM